MKKEEFCEKLAEQLAASRKYIAGFQEEGDGRVEQRKYAVLVNDLYRTELAARQYGGLQPNNMTSLLF